MLTLTDIPLRERVGTRVRDRSITELGIGTVVAVATAHTVDVEWPEHGRDDDLDSALLEVIV